ncbi:MAG: SRPBCC domain-containing protein [Polyangiales bacterium]
MHGLRTLILHVADLDAAKRFYTAALQKPPYFDEPFYVGFDLDGYELGLHPREGADLRPTTYLATDDVDAELARWTALGATPLDAPQDVGDGLFVAAVRDPFGNAIGLIRNLDFAPKLVEAAADDLAPDAIVHEVTVPIAPAAVWSLWSSAEGLQRWLVKRAKVDLRPGGAYEIYFLHEGPRGLQGSETCRVLSFIPGRMLSFTWNAPPSIAPTRAKHTWVVVELEAADAGTRVRVTHLGWPAAGMRDEPAWAETHAYFARAWAWVLRELSAYAAR